jgi:hypothetical protein
VAFESSWLEGVPQPRVELIDDPQLRELAASSRDQFDNAGMGDLWAGYVWGILVAQEGLQLAQANAAYPFADRIGFGFVEPLIDQSDPGLAVIVEMCPPLDPFVSEDLTEILGFPSQREIYIENGRTTMRFPVIPRVVVREPQNALSYPSTALLTAWMEIRRSTTPRQGWLLPLHAVRPPGPPLGLGVSYADGSYGRVIDGLGTCMDVAIASTSSAPQNLQPRNPDYLLPPGLQVTVADQRGTVRVQRVMDVDVNVGLLRYQKAPMRLSYDWSSSVPGDSGALISNATTFAPVAMHQGASWIRDLSGNQLIDQDCQPVRRAFGICLFQVAHQFDGEVYL